MKLEQHCSDRRRKSEKDEKDEDQIIQTRFEYMAPFHGWIWYIIKNVLSVSDVTKLTQGLHRDGFVIKTTLSSLIVFK